MGQSAIGSANECNLIGPTAGLLLYNYASSEDDDNNKRTKT